VVVSCRFTHHWQDFDQLDGQPSTLDRVLDHRSFFNITLVDQIYIHDTTGFEMSVRWYHQRLMQLVVLLSFSTNKVHPANRKLVADFLSSSSMLDVNLIFAGLTDIDMDEDYFSQEIFDKFKYYIRGEEDRMKSILESITYNIDDENALTLVIGRGRPEKVCVSFLVVLQSKTDKSCMQNLMPLLHLLLTRALRILDLAENIVLHPNELNLMTQSLEVIVTAVYERIANLTGKHILLYCVPKISSGLSYVSGVFKLQNLDVEKQSKKFFFGLVSATLA
jgi:hypothetical protein